MGGKKEGRKEEVRGRRKGQKKEAARKPFAIEVNSLERISRGYCLSNNFKEMTCQRPANEAFLPLPAIDLHFSFQPLSSHPWFIPLVSRVPLVLPSALLQGQLSAAPLTMLH